MGEPPPLLIALTIGLVFIARPILMGCFSSKEEPTYAPKPPTHQYVQPAPPLTQPNQPHQQHQSPQQLPHQQPQPAPVTQSQDVVSLPRPAVTYGEREKNELKVKNLRDKLETTIITSEQVLQDEAKIAVRMHKEGNKAHARVLLQRRRHTHRKIDNCQTMLATVMEMIQTMDMAADNAKFIQAVESGTKAVKDVMDGMSVERVHMALDDARNAEEYTNEIGAAMTADQDVLDDEEFEQQVAEMSQRYGTPEEVEEEVVEDGHPDVRAGQTPANVVAPVNVEAPAANGEIVEGKVSSFVDAAETADEKTAAIPTVPTELPPDPVALEHVEKEDIEPAAIAM